MIGQQKKRAPLRRMNRPQDKELMDHAILISARLQITLEKSLGDPKGRPFIGDRHMNTRTASTIHISAWFQITLKKKGRPKKAAPHQGSHNSNRVGIHINNTTKVYELKEYIYKY